MCVLPLGTITASADIATTLNGVTLTYFIAEGEAIISDCDENISGDVVIPSTLDGYPVTYISEDAFEYCSRITSLTIPSSVRGIGASAFFECSSLEKVIISDSVTTIGEAAFFLCNLLETVYFTGNEEEWNNISIACRKRLFIKCYHSLCMLCRYGFKAYITATFEEKEPASDGYENITASYITILRKYLLSGNTENLDYDVNGDNKVDLKDLVYAKKTAAGLV